MRWSPHRPSTAPCLCSRPLRLYPLAQWSDPRRTSPAPARARLPWRPCSHDCAGGLLPNPTQPPEQAPFLRGTRRLRMPSPPLGVPNPALMSATSSFRGGLLVSSHPPSREPICLLLACFRLLPPS
ncbi:hypothetical protein Mapa_016044 [Marchantia paleacea]|nr:hypothetical protein Mapa_016044 [Marchantia paleacea]